MAKLNVGMIGKGTLHIEVVENLDEALDKAGLQRGKVDHGGIRMGDVRLGVVVWEFGMFERPDKMHYWAIGKSMYAGNAVLYEIDEAGDTIDIQASHLPPVRFFRDHDAVEQAIQMGVIERPQQSVNGLVTWRWPHPNDMYKRDPV